MGVARRDRVRKEATRLLAAGVAGQVFPGGVVSISWREGGEVVFVEAFAGRLNDHGPLVDALTPYDVASLTKPVVATAALRMVAAGTLSLDVRADSLVSDVRGGTGGNATLEQLLTHRAGLAPWGGLYLDVPHEPGSAAARRWIISEASRRPDESGGGAGGARAVYSDLGYIIAGEVLSRVAAEPLDRVVAHQVTEPLGIADQVFYLGALGPSERAAVTKRVAPTERCEWRGRIIRGEVHDENCAALGGVAGNAGIFATAHGIAVVARAVLDSFLGKGTFLPRALVEHALEARDGGTPRLGWDARNAGESSAGKRMGPRTFGHLGFTGGSVWCDPDKDVVVALLTNRVHPSRANERIKGFRPAFHDGVLSNLV